MVKQRQLEQIRLALQRMKTLDKKISSLEGQLKRLKEERQTLYNEYLEFVDQTGIENAIYLLGEHDGKFKNSLMFGDLSRSPIGEGVK